MYGFYNMMSGGGVGWLFMLLIWVFLIFGSVELVRYIVRSDKSNTNAKDKSPLEILKERYAKGEINRSEYEEKKKDLA